jgi:hypothetical protein
MSELRIRKTVKHVDTTYIEAGKAADQPVMLVAMAAVIANPWAGRGYVEDLRSTIVACAPELAEALVPPLLSELGGAERLEAYGKAAVVGVNGEIEHASGFIHTLRFGNRFRDAVGGTSYLSFTNRRAGAGTSIQIPMMHKTDEGLRSHYLTVSFSIEDAPGPDEIVVALGGAASGRAHPRIGNRYMDMEEMGIAGNTGLGKEG